MSSRHTLSDILLYDAISAKRVLLALESQVLLQDLRTMEGASEKMISGHTSRISISSSAYLVGASRSTQVEGCLTVLIEGKIPEIAG